jgi:hypothetical protein
MQTTDAIADAILKVDLHTSWHILCGSVGNDFGEIYSDLALTESGKYWVPAKCKDLETLTLASC